jgi:hypothetical protein
VLHRLALGVELLGRDVAERHHAVQPPLRKNLIGHPGHDNATVVVATPEWLFPEGTGKPSR